MTDRTYHRQLTIPIMKGKEKIIDEKENKNSTHNIALHEKKNK